MNNKQPLGKLEKIDVREYWEKEDKHFTPWLAQEENIALLGDEIGIELEVQQTEQHIGPFRADIVCVDKNDTTSDQTKLKILIENQLENTDHSHLGQILTYAAGLEAPIIAVWIAKKFTEKHRAALDMLNDITDETIHFFGFEIELWRIGDSQPAPQLNAVVRPNEWKEVSKSDKNSTKNPLYYEYWTEFCEAYRDRKTRIRIGKAQAQTCMEFFTWLGGINLTAVVSSQHKRLRIQITITKGKNRLAYFNLLQQHRAEIDKKIGVTLEWKERVNEVESHIKKNFDDYFDPSDETNWPEQHKMIFEKLELFHSTFAPLIKELDATEWEPENSQT